MPERAQNMPKICLRYAQDTPKIFPRYTQDRSKKCQQYEEKNNIHKIYEKICQDITKNTEDMLKISTKIYPRLAQDLSKIFPNFTCYTCQSYTILV